MKYLFLILFILFCIIHLFYSYTDNSKNRAKTKPFLLLFLALFYFFATKDMQPYLLLALLTSWLGDVLLIPSGKSWFVMGGLSFLLSHFFFIKVYLTHISFTNMPWVLITIVAILYFGISLKIMDSVKDNTPKAMIFPMFLYLIANSTMNIFGLMQLVSRQNIGALTAYIGALLFFISDCILFLVRYHINKNLIFKKHFMVMFTYLLGEFLITVGILIIRG